MTLEEACYRFGYSPEKFVKNSIEHGADHSRSLVQRSYEARVYGARYEEARDYFYEFIKLIHGENRCSS